MRSTLVHVRKRACPMCDNAGFRKVDSDFFGQAIMRCSACGHEWPERRGDNHYANKTPPKVKQPRPSNFDSE